MQNYIKIGFLLILLISIGCKGNKPAEIDKEPLKLHTYFADEDSFGVTSVIVEGLHELLLIDAQFTLAHAQSLLAQIQALNKPLSTVYISHHDPDYYFGLEVFKAAFPDLRIYATAGVRREIMASYEAKLQAWAHLGESISSTIIIPELLPQAQFIVDDQEINIMDEALFPNNTYVYIPSLRAILGGVSVFGDDFHLWMADSARPELRQRWLAILDRIASHNPLLVIPGHGSVDSSLDLKSVEYTQEYIRYYSEALLQYEHSADLIAYIKERYPAQKFTLALHLGAQVIMNEIPW